MKFPLVSPCRALVVALLGLAFLPLDSRAQNLPSPTVVNPLTNITVAAGTTSSVVNLKKTFGLPGLTGQVVRFDTSLGNIDVELDAADAPNTVANFLGYVNNGSYTNSFFHRSVANFIIQGGGYDVQNGMVQMITAAAPVVNEFKVSNLRGTIAMAKLGSDPNSATDEWFFNLGDNSANLDNQNGGFTVFGQIIGSAGLAVMDSIAALRIENAGSPFDELPVLASYSSGTTVSLNDLVYANTISVLPLLPTATAPGFLKLKAKNSNPGLLTAVLKGPKLHLNYTGGQTGVATIKVLAINSDGAQAKSVFKVTVQ